jgi:adenylate cyclase
LYYLFDGYRAKMLSIAASVATVMDGDLLERLNSEPNQHSPDYLQLRETLTRARDANRRPDTDVRRMFTVSRAPSNANVLLVGVDTAESLESRAHPGEVYRTDSTKAANFDQAFVEDKFVRDEFGIFLHAYAPVRDRAGRIVGAVVVASAESWVDSKMRPILISSLLSMLLACCITIPAALLMSRLAGRPLRELQQGVLRIGEGDLETQIPVHSKDEFGAVAEAINSMAVGLRERDHVKRTFAHYVSHQVLDSILKSGQEIQLQGHRRRISVLFADIRGFSTISERLPPEKVVQMLNDYFEQMVEIIFRNGGMLDKFLGDGMMVIFGAPEDDQYQEQRALRTAIEMQHEMRGLTDKWDKEGIHLRIGIGINSGPAIVGNIGSSRRMEYTAIGDTVNLASRLESATKELGVPILISEYTYNALRGTTPFRQMGSITVKGRTEAVLTYTPEDEVEKATIDEQNPAEAIKAV